ncbi:hypothetical protein F5J12DRAFT_727077, partial [Pisolithus orientalis]|uniref:uncharacterized protein n=1 Tax=Pisolithus orientalis TaxID=936130 RepID=UPI00222401D1
AMCVVFAGGAYLPTLDALCKFPLVLVSKGRVQTLIEWLVAHNMWYKANSVTFLQDILESLVVGDGEEGLLAGMQITHLPDAGAMPTSCGFEWETLSNDLVMECVACTQGDHLEHSCWAMKAGAHTHALQGKKFIVSQIFGTLMRMHPSLTLIVCAWK